MAVVSLTSVAVSDLCCSIALRSRAPRIVTLTTLAESKCLPCLSAQTTPFTRSFTVSATVDERLLTAARMSRDSRAASAGCEEEWQMLRRAGVRRMPLAACRWLRPRCPRSGALRSRATAGNTTSRPAATPQTRGRAKDLAVVSSQAMVHDGISS